MLARRRKPGKKKTVKNPLENVESTQKVGTADVVTGRGRTTPVPARGKPGKKTVQFFTGPLTDPFLAGADKIAAISVAISAVFSTD